MIHMKVTLEGVDEVNKKLVTLADQAPGTAKDEIAKGALEIQRWGKKFCPVQTGRLRASIAIDFWPGGMTADIGTSVWYGPHVEFGTTRQRAHPFLQPAWDLVRPQLLKSINQSFKVMTRREFPN